MKYLLLTILTMQTLPLSAHDIFEYQGPHSRANGGAGVILSESGSAVLDNPANLWSSEQTDNYIDVAPTRLVYRLTTPDPKIKPGVINVPILPLTSVGGSYKGPNSRLSYGYIFIPTGFGKAVEVKNFPVFIEGLYESANIKSTQKGFKLGAGTAFKVTDSLVLGFSLLANNAGLNTNVTSNNSELIYIESSLNSLYFGFGTRYVWDGVGIFAASYRPSVDMHYNLKARIADSETENFYQRDYKPSVFGLGVLLNDKGTFQPYGQFTYEKWIEATTINAQGPTQAVTGTDAPIEYLNSRGFVLGARYVLPTRNVLSLAFSSFTKNKGAGIMNQDGEILMKGRGAQDFEALDRKHYTLGYALMGDQADMFLYGSYIRATAISEINTPSAGFYELTAYMLGLGYVWH